MNLLEEKRTRVDPDARSIPFLDGRPTMKKLKLDLDGVAVESFATTARPVEEVRGTLHAHEASGVPCDATRSCPTNYCATIPLTCPSVFAPTCGE